MFVAPFGSGKTTALAKIRDSGHPSDLIQDDLTSNEVALLVGKHPDLPLRVATNALLTEDRLEISDAVVLIEQQALWISVEEIEQHLRDTISTFVAAPALAAAIWEGTGGWPVLVHAILATLEDLDATFPSIETLCRTGPHIQTLRRSFWNSIDAADTDFVQASLHALPLTRAAADLIASRRDGVGHLQQCGLPLIERGDSTFDSYPILLPPGPPTPSFSTYISALDLSAIAEALEEATTPAAALRTLIAFGAYEQAQTSLLRVAQHRSASSDPVELLAVQEIIAANVEPNPKLLLCKAALLARMDAFEDSLTTYKLASAMGADDPQGAFEAELRQLVLTAGIDSERDAAMLSDMVERQADMGNQRTSLLVGILRLTVDWNSPRQNLVSASIERGKLLAGRLVAAGMPDEAALLLRRLAAGPCAHLWRFQAASSLLDRSEEMGRRFNLTPAVWLPVLRYLIAAESADSAACGRWEPLASALAKESETGSLAASFWNAKLTCSALLGETQEAIHYAMRFTEFFGEFSDTHIELYHRCRAAASLSYCNAGTQAAIHLRIAEPLRQLNELEFFLAQITYEARCGDAGKALELVAGNTIRTPDIPFERQWQLDLEVLHAELRLGRRPSSSSEDILRDADKSGLRERARLMLPHRTGLTPTKPATRVTTFGRFSISAKGGSTFPNESNPTRLLKLMAIRGPVVSIDTIIASLWPDDPYETCRRRLKNLVSRARQTIGDDCLDRSQEFVSFRPTVEVDYIRFHDLARQTTLAQTTKHQRAEAARAALDLVDGPLLPSELYTEWVSEARWQTDAAIQRMLQVLIDTLENTQSGWLLDTANRVSCAAPEPYLAIRQMAVAADQTDVARSALDTASRLADELGITI